MKKFKDGKDYVSFHSTVPTKPQVNEVEIAEGTKITLNGKTVDCQIISVTGNLMHLHIEGKRVNLRLQPGEETGEYHVTLNGTKSQARVQTELERRVQELGGGSNGTQKIEFIKAAMPGVVTKVLTSKGSRVKTGDGLLILEAMKMENQIKAKHDGTVEKILVSEGQTVDMGQKLIQLD